MNFETKFLANTALGLFLGSISMLALVWTLDTGANAEIARLRVFIYTALISLLASALALAGVLSNLDLQRRLNQEARERKADSARAVSPNAISQFMNSAKIGLRHNYNLSVVGVINDLAETQSTESLAITDNTIVVFRDLIENSSDKLLREHLFELLREHQVLVARSESTFWHAGNSPSKEDYRHVTYWAYLLAVTGLVLGYLRGDTDKLINELTVKDIQGALHVNGFLLTPASFANYAEHIDLYVRRYSKRLA